MDIKQRIFWVLALLFGSSVATAGGMGPAQFSRGLHPLVSLQGGYASLNAAGGARFVGTDADVFTYFNSGSAENNGFIGGFLGVERDALWTSYPGLFMQIGLEYNYFPKTNVAGINTVGVESQTSTTYSYEYKAQTQQALGMLKLFTTCHQRFYPYAELGLGAAFNRAGQYHAVTTETGSINLTPGFNSQTQTEFTYSLGLGVETQVNTNIRLGLGYRYSNFGSSSLANGRVTFNTYQSQVPFALGRSNSYANQLLARISYLA